MILRVCKSWFLPSLTSNSKIFAIIVAASALLNTLLGENVPSGIPEITFYELNNKQTLVPIPERQEMIAALLAL